MEHSRDNHRMREQQHFSFWPQVLSAMRLLFQQATRPGPFTTIGGQAVIEGVMMRSPNAFVVAVRRRDGRIRLRRDQWFGLGKRWKWWRKPFLRGVLVLLETMANGIVALNYAARIALEDEQLASAKADTDAAKMQAQVAAAKKHEKIGLDTFLAILMAFVFAILLFILLPHGLTALLDNWAGSHWGLESFWFHLVDGIIKAIILVLYIYLIGLLPDIKRVFQYHGAEHKSISCFEAGDPLLPAAAAKYTTFHPRCGTSFLFFLLFISIIFFAVFFVIFPLPSTIPTILRHILAVVIKVGLAFPIAAVSYEVIKGSAKCTQTWWGKILMAPGILLQHLTTREPDAAQLEVALASIKAVLLLEEKYDLKAAQKKILTAQEIDIHDLQELETGHLSGKDFLE